MAPFEWLLLTAIILFVGVFIEALVAGAFLRRSLGLRGWALVLGANVASFTLVLLSEVVGQRYFF